MMRRAAQRFLLVEGGADVDLRAHVAGNELHNLQTELNGESIHCQLEHLLRSFGIGLGVSECRVNKRDVTGIATQTSLTHKERVRGRVRDVTRLAECLQNVEVARVNRQRRHRSQLRKLRLW